MNCNIKGNGYNAEDEQVTMAWLMGGVPDDADFEFIAW